MTTSEKVGLDRIGDSGRSEYLVIYGGLELAMALIFFAPWLNRNYVEPSLLACIVIHACLVAYRMASYLTYSEISGLTHRLAIGEWVMLIVAVVVWFVGRGSAIES